MAEEKTISAALGQSAKMSISDLGGVPHRLYPIRLGDFAELERMVGGISDWKLLASSMTAWQSILWLSMRRHGLSAKQVKERAWNITVEDVGEMFDGRQLGEIGTAILEIFVTSGVLPETVLAKGGAKTPDPTKGGESAPTTKTEGGQSSSTPPSL